MNKTALKAVRETVNAVLAKREPWLNEWGAIAKVLLPYAVQLRGRRGVEWRAERKDQSIVNDYPCRAIEDLSAGLMARITSPARKWFGLQVTDSGQSADESTLDNQGKKYLDRMTAIIGSDLSSGGWYAALSMSTYLDLAAFGTACVFADEQPDGSIVYDPVPIGRFAIDVNHLNKVDTFVREWSATAQQIVKRFGRDNISRNVKMALNANDHKTEFDVIHAVLPLEEPNARGQRWSSTWYERNEESTGKTLSEGGYYEFPALCPRWTVRAGDVYGRGPGDKALGNIRMLQHYTRGMVQMLDRVIDPPKAVIGGNADLSFLPGAVTHVSAMNGATVAVEDLLKITPENFTVCANYIEQLKKDIGDAFFAQLWKMFSDEDRSDITAAEIEARRQEQALRAGPLLESLNGELLEPAVEMRIEQMKRLGMLVDMPESLMEANIKVEFISVMHSMQQATAVNSMRAWLADVAGVANIDPSVVDNVNGDSVVHELARAAGIPADSLNDKALVKKTRAAKAAAQKQAIAGQQALNFAKGAKDIGSIDPERLQANAGALVPAAQAQGGVQVAA